MKYEALETLKAYKYLGEKLLSDGTLLIGKAPHIAPKAWLHTLYSPLQDIEIEELQADCKHSIPSNYRDFLSETNGLAVFNTTLSLYGKRKNFIRNEENVWQPFDIVIPNTLERPKTANEDMLIIGSYSYDGSKLYLDNTTNKVHLSERYNYKSLFQWNSFDEMLSSEIDRLMKLFDKDGKKIRKGISTLPF